MAFTRQINNILLPNCSRLMSLEKGFPLMLSQPVRTKNINFYNRFTGVSRNFLAKVQQPVDLTAGGIRNWIDKTKWEKIRIDQKCDLKRVGILGPDIALAHFVVSNGGAIQFKGSKRWVEKDSKGNFILPTTKVPMLYVEAVDCSNMNIMYDSFDNFKDLEELKYLKLSGCKYIDDWCMDRMIMFKDSLVHLDVSGCPNLSERGLTALHKLSKLQILEMGDMSSVQQPTLFALMLEEVLPLCQVQGVDRSEEKVTLETEPPTPAFIRNLLHVDDDADFWNTSKSSGVISSEIQDSRNARSFQ